MGNYVTATGLARKTLQEVRLEIETSLKQAFGPSFETSVDSPNGLLISQLALAISNQWDLAQEVFVSRDPSQATGLALDWAAVLTGVTRKTATPCRVQAVLYADSDTATIPSGSSAMRSRGNLEFTLDSDVGINIASCDELLIVDDGSARSTAYVFPFTFGSITLNNSSTQSNLSVLRSLVISAGAQAELSARGLRVYMANGSPVGLTGAAPDNFDVLPGSLGSFTAVQAGYQTCLSGELDSVASSVSGWVDVYNYAAAVPGSEAEGDTALRIRRDQASRSIKARGTDPAVAAHISEDVEGVTLAVVRSNRSLITDADGRPGKSFEAFVVGGSDHDVAMSIYRNQASGIQSYGNTSVTIQDDNGDEQVISFSRPQAKYLWVKIAYTPYSEEDISTDAEIKAALLTWASQEYSMGKDVIPDRIKGGLYQGTTGLGSSTIQVAVTDTAAATPSYVGNVIPVSSRSYVSLDASRIVIVRES